MLVDDVAQSLAANEILKALKFAVGHRLHGGGVGDDMQTALFGLHLQGGAVAVSARRRLYAAAIVDLEPGEQPVNVGVIRPFEELAIPQHRFDPVADANLVGEWLNPVFVRLRKGGRQKCDAKQRPLGAAANLVHQMTAFLISRPDS